MREESSKPGTSSQTSRIEPGVNRNGLQRSQPVNSVIELYAAAFPWPYKLQTATSAKRKKRTLIAYYLRGILLAGSSFFTTLFSYDFPLAHCVTNTVAAALVFLLFSFTL